MLSEEERSMLLKPRRAVLGCARDCWAAYCLPLEGAASKQLLGNDFHERRILILTEGCYKIKHLTNRKDVAFPLKQIQFVFLSCTLFPREHTNEP